MLKPNEIVVLSYDEDPPMKWDTPALERLSRALFPKPHIVKDNAGLWTIINYHARIGNPHEPLFDKAWFYVRRMNFPELP